MVPPLRPPLKLIANQKSRKLTFRGRSIGLKKKSSELSTLCGIDVAIIMYEDHQAQPVFWPPDVEKVKSILGRYKTHREEERAVKRSDLSGIFQERTWNMLGNLNGEGAYPTWDDRLKDFSVDELREVLCNLESLEGEIELEMIKRILSEDKWASKDESIGASGSNTLPHTSDPLMHSENIMFNSPPGPSATCYCLANSQVYTIPLQHSLYHNQQHSLYHDQQHSFYHNQLENPGPSAAFYYPPNTHIYTSSLRQLENAGPSATFHCLPTTQVYSSPLLHPLDYGLAMFNNPGASAAYASADMSDDALVD